MNYLSFSTMATAAMLIATGCGTSRNEEVPSQKDAAVFESFSYKGNDDFYAARSRHGVAHTSWRCRHTSTAVAGGFTGTTVGPYASRI